MFPLAHTELWARVWQNVQIDVTMSNTKQMSQITLIMDKGHPSLTSSPAELPDPFVDKKQTKM